MVYAIVVIRRMFTLDTLKKRVIIMKVLLHDLDPEIFAKLCPNLSENICVISQKEPIKKCIGCFGCWLKTPGECIIQDGYGSLGKKMGESTDYIIISRVIYGGLSPFVKNVLDRNINYILPYFEVRNKEMHHKPRYSKQIRFTVIGYGEDITKGEAKTFTNLINAIGVNLNVSGIQQTLVRNVSELSTTPIFKEALS